MKMLSSNTFIRILGSIWTNGWKNIAYWEESEQREVLANKFGLSQIQLGILVVVTAPGKFCNFSPFLSLGIGIGNSVHATEVLAIRNAMNIYINYLMFYLRRQHVK